MAGLWRWFRMAISSRSTCRPARFSSKSPDEELATASAAWSFPGQAAQRGGYGSLYVKTVMQADTGADLDFLVGSRGSEIPMNRDSH